MAGLLTPVKVDIGPETYTLTGRVARIIMWLTLRAERINQVEAGNIRFDFAGEHIRPHITESYTNDSETHHQA